jgi:hypothetical protein
MALVGRGVAPGVQQQKASVNLNVLAVHPSTFHIIGAASEKSLPSP